MAIFSVHVIAGTLAALLFTGDPFLFLAPEVRLSAADRRDLEAGAVIARTLESGAGQVAVLSITRTDVSPETLITSARRIEDLKRSSFVTAIKRFSNPPRLEDLDDLRLSQRDLAAAAACKPANCSFRLTADETTALRRAGADPDRDAALQSAFRQVVFARVQAYLDGVLTSLRPAVSPAVPPAPDAFLWLRDFPNDHRPVESFLYWSQETYGIGKPVVVVTHVSLIPPSSPGDRAIVLGRQVMATRYMTGGLSLMAVTTDDASGVKYLVYLNRTGVDLLGGFFGPIKRAMLESRLKGEVPNIILKLRARLERTSGESR